MLLKISLVSGLASGWIAVTSPAPGCGLLLTMRWLQPAGGPRSMTVPVAMNGAWRRVTSKSRGVERPLYTK